MAHKHSVYDTDNHFMIDGVTRAVRNASQTKTMVVQGDHNSERFTFEIPRYVDAHDMSVCNVVQVHYTNTDSKDSTKFNDGVYSVDDLQVSPDDEDVVICSWLISGNATKYVGKLEFGIRFSCVSDDGKLDYVWNTAKHTNVYVTEGIYNGDVIAEEYVDILAQHEARIKALEQGGGTGGGDPELFLYGTPSESGNIGLRVGDSVTYYNGAVLQKLPESDMPYAHIYSTELDLIPYGAIFSENPFVFNGNKSILLDGMVGKWHYSENSVWWNYAEYDATDTANSYPAIWTNHDIKDVNGNLHLAATNPIPVTKGIVDTINGIPIYE